MPELKLDDLEGKVSALQASIDKMLAGQMLLVPHASDPQGGTPRPGTSLAVEYDPFAQLDLRIAGSPTSEGEKLVYIRQELVRQQEVVAGRAHVRRLEVHNFYAKVGLSVTAFASGIGLVVAGFGLPGFVCLGAGLYAIAPNFIDRVTDKILGEKKQ
jgi:hypothetical protein